MSADIKVTDKRMFNEYGELREEFRHLGEEGGKGASAKGDSSRSSSSAAASEKAATEPGADTGSTPFEPLPKPGFLDLVSMLAEPVAIFLGDLPAPDGTKQENLPIAKLHIDMLEILRQKTEGNLDVREKATLEELLYQLRLRFVSKAGGAGSGQRP